MIRPPTFTHGPLQAHELDELAELLDELDCWISQLDDVPEHWRIRVSWWAWRLANLGAQR
jgi:hypothetical protein